MTKKDELVKAARDVQRIAYAKFSGFKVGAAIQTVDGRIFTGCNIENSSYGLSICAERVALFKAVSEGVVDFTILTVFSDAFPPSRPCGACRQTLFEFNPQLLVICANHQGIKDEFVLSDLLPDGFKLD